jgi:hypothetical protein
MNGHLFAAPGDWISMLIPIVVAIIWVLNQVFSNLAQKPNRPEARRPNAPPRPPQNPRVNEEIEKFLRRAAQQQQQQQQPQQPQRGRPEQRPAAPRQAPRTLVQKEAFKRPAPVVPATVVEAEMVDGGPAIRGKSVDDHVQKYFGSSQFKERSAAPLSKVDQADEMLESHLHQVFDRQLGTLASKSVEAPAPGASAPVAPAAMPTPAGIAALLRNPSNLRSAIILQEILAPPESRW